MEHLAHFVGGVFLLFSVGGIIKFSLTKKLDDIEIIILMLCFGLSAMLLLY